MIWNLIRHGQTDWNLQRRFQGQTDIPLNDTGRNQALEAAAKCKKEGLHFCRVYSSPLERAVETAEIVSGIKREDPRFFIDQRLIEMDFGPLDGTAFDHEHNEKIGCLFTHPSQFQFPEGMETYEELRTRTADFISSLLEKEGASGDGNILIQSHGACLRGLLARLSQLETDDFWRMTIDNCELFRYRVEEGRITKLDRPLQLNRIPR